MTENMPAEITGPERHVYSVGADRARKSYRTRHGANVTLSLVERRAWNAEHAEGLSAAALRGGMAAVRKLHTARVEILATMTDVTRIGGPASGEYLARITADAEHAAERLAALATIGKAPRKAAAKRKPAAAKVAAPEVSPVVVEIAPETVPAPMPAMTRAARKATRRELAATMRAAGIRPEGQAWRGACAAAGLLPADQVRA